MAGKGIRLGRIFGIKISLDWSWLLIFLLVTWNLTVVFSNLHPEWGFGLNLAISLLASLLFFASVLAHELAHSLMAIAQGVPVRGITLFLFGGVASIEREPPTARAEFLITIVGPLTSIGLGLIFLMLASVGATLSLNAIENPAQLLANLGPLTTLLMWLGPINIILGVFNMIPGFPLDGGRVLRSILWAITGNLRRATRWASYVGQAVAWLLIIAGIAMVFGAQVPLLGGGLIGGIWLAFIGWFLNNAAIQSYRQVVVQDLLEDLPVDAIMRRDPPTVNADQTVGNLVYDGVMGTDDHAFPVLDNGRLVGLVCLHDIRGLARERWDSTPVTAIMTPREELVTITPQAEADEALNKLRQDDHRQLPVLEQERLVGMLRRRDILRWLQLQAGQNGNV